MHSYNPTIMQIKPAYTLRTLQVTKYGDSQFNHALPNPRPFWIPKVMSATNASYVVCTTGRYNIFEHVFALGNLDFSPHASGWCRN